jgi:nucleotide-binding universal stress UspA family protein
MKTIVAAVDLSETSREVLRWARLLAERFEARLKIVHVLPDLKSYTGFYLTAKPVDALQRELEIESEEKLLWLGRELLGDPKFYDVTVLIGTPPQALAKYLKSAAADLLIVGCHGHPKPEHKLFGATAERLLKTSPCPVMTVGQELLSHA